MCKGNVYIESSLLSTVSSVIIIMAVTTVCIIIIIIMGWLWASTLQNTLLACAQTLTEHIRSSLYAGQMKVWKQQEFHAIRQHSAI